MAEKDDLAGLIAKRDELLGEVKALRTRIVEVERERDAMKDKVMASEAALRRFKVDDPLEEMASMFALPKRFAVQLLRDHFDFDLGEDGRVAVKDKSGGELGIAFTTDAIATKAMLVPELAEHIRKPKGPEAPGNMGRAQPIEPKPKAKAVVPRLGLR